MNIQFKKLHPEAKIPTKANETDAGFDLTAVGVTILSDYIEYDIGISMAIPEGYVGLCFPRSSVSKTTQWLANSVGVIDSGYRGPFKLRFKYFRQLNGNPNGEIYRAGDRVGQLIILPIPSIEYVEVGELDETKRGGKGFGSSGS